MSRSQTIGNQTSSFRSRIPEYDKSLPTTRKMGILVSGLPSTRKVEKLENYMTSSEKLHKRLHKEHIENSKDFHLHYHQWYNGPETTGGGARTLDALRSLLVAAFRLQVTHGHSNTFMRSSTRSSGVICAFVPRRWSRMYHTALKTLTTAANVSPSNDR